MDLPSCARRASLTPQASPHGRWPSRLWLSQLRFPRRLQRALGGWTSRRTIPKLPCFNTWAPAAALAPGNSPRPAQRCNQPFWSRGALLGPGPGAADSGGNAVWFCLFNTSGRWADFPIPHGPWVCRLPPATLPLVNPRLERLRRGIHVVGGVLPMSPLLDPCDEAMRPSKQQLVAFRGDSTRIYSA